MRWRVVELQVLEGHCDHVVLLKFRNCFKGIGVVLSKAKFFPDLLRKVDSVKVHVNLFVTESHSVRMLSSVSEDAS